MKGKIFGVASNKCGFVKGLKGFMTSIFLVNTV